MTKKAGLAAGLKSATRGVGQIKLPKWAKINQLPNAIAVLLVLCFAGSAQDHTGWRDYGGATDAAQYSACTRSIAATSLASKSRGASLREIT
jgi:hypothetical protein